MSINYDYEKEATEEEIARWMGCLEGMDQYSEDVMAQCELVSLDSVKTYTTRRGLEDVLIDHMEFTEFWDTTYSPEEITELMCEGGYEPCIM